MTQKRHVLTILAKFEMSECKSRSTPCEQKLSLDNEGEVIIEQDTELVAWYTVHHHLY